VNRTVATQLHGSGGDPCQGTVYGPVDGGPGDLGPGKREMGLEQQHPAIILNCCNHEPSDFYSIGNNFSFSF
jgi:hypothetical protein